MAGIASFPNSDSIPSCHFVILATQAPARLSVCQALRWGQVSAAGGSAALLEQVLASPMVADLANEPIWSRLIV